jgi:hypothetical protein
VGDGFGCTFPSDCCSGICDGGTCGTPGCADYGQACSNADGCCGGSCNGSATCVWKCLTGSGDFGCFSDVCATSLQPLDPSCGVSDPGWVDGECVEAVCAEDPYCCCTAWDGMCVSEVPTFCGYSC